MINNEYNLGKSPVMIATFIILFITVAVLSFLFLL